MIHMMLEHHELVMNGKPLDGFHGRGYFIH
jgi:hypothetical protein